MDEWVADMEDLMTHLVDFGPVRYPIRYVPETGIARKLFGTSFSDLRVDVTEHEDEIIVTADLPGARKEDVSIKLVDPRTLQVSCEKKEESLSGDEGGEVKEKEYYMQERIYGSISRDVPLPAEVGHDGAVATYRNGVIEVRLKKSAAVTAKEITIT